MMLQGREGVRKIIITGPSISLHEAFSLDPYQKALCPFGLLMSFLGLLQIDYVD